MDNCFQKIPEGWSVKKLGEVTTLLTNGFVGSATPHYTEDETGVTYIQGFNVNINSFDLTGIKKVTLEFHKKNKKSCLQEGDLLTIQTGGIGVTARVPKYLAGSNCHALIISRFDTAICNSKFYLQYYNSSICQSRFKKIETGSTMKHLNVGDLESEYVPIPPLAEQEKIAEILGTWDEGIEKLSSLIEKKKLLKKGLMQKLLTGKTRLNGFTQPWQEVKLGEIGTTYTGLSGKNKDDFGCGSQFIPYMNIYQNNHINPQYLELVEIGEGERQNTVKYGDIFFTTSSETPNEVGFASVLLFKPERNIYLNSFCFGYRLNNFKSLLPEYASFLFRSIHARKIMYKLAQGATRFNLSKNELMKEKIYIPSEISEQQAIADVLSTADDEINLLNKKLDALKEQKKGLMQQLLTGQIRVKVN